MEKSGKIFIYSLSVFFIIFGIFMLYLNFQVIFGGEKLVGKVVAYESRDQSTPRGIQGTTFAPVVEFEYKGELLRIPSQMSAAWKGFDIGEVVYLYFDPSDRDEVIIDRLYQKYGFGTLIIVAGVVCLFLPNLF